MSLSDLVGRATSVPDWGPTILAVTLGLTIVATVFVILRIYYRWSIVQLGRDDVCCVIALVCFFQDIALACLTCIGLLHCSFSKRCKRYDYIIDI